MSHQRQSQGRLSTQRQQNFRISQEPGTQTNRFSKDNDMETQVNFSRHSSQPKNVKTQRSTSRNLLNIKIDEGVLKQVGADNHKESTVETEQTKQSRTTRHSVKLDSQQQFARFKVKPAFLNQYITSFRELEMSLDQERYFPQEEILSPRQLEYRMKKLDHIDKRLRFKSILDQMRSKVAKKDSFNTSEPIQSSRLSGEPHSQNVSRSNMVTALQIKGVQPRLDLFKPSISLVGGSVTSRSQGRSVQQTVSQKKKSEFGQALQLAMQKGLITKNSIEKQLRLGNTIDVQCNLAKTKQLKERRAMLRTQQESRYAKFRGSRRPTLTTDSLQADKFIRSVYGQNMIEQSTTDILDQADNQIATTLGAWQQPLAHDDQEHMQAQYDTSQIATPRYSHQATSTNDHSSAVPSKDISQVLRVRMDRPQRHQSSIESDKNYAGQHAVKQGARGAAFTQTQKQGKNLVLRMPTVKRSQRNQVPVLFGLDIKTHSSVGRSPQVDTVYKYSTGGTGKNAENFSQLTIGTIQSPKLAKKTKIELVQTGEKSKESQARQGSLMMSPFSTRSKGVSLEQSIYLEDAEISLPRFEERFECIGRSFQNTLTPMSGTPNIEMKDQGIGEKKLPSSKKRAVQKRLTGIVGVAYQRNRGENADFNTPKQGVFQQVRGLRPNHTFASGKETNREQDKSASKMSHEPDQMMLQPVLSANQSYTNRTMNDIQVDAASSPQIQTSTNGMPRWSPPISDLSFKHPN